MESDETLQTKLEYAKNVLGNVSGLLQFMDQKAGFIVALAIFFVSSIFSVLQVYTGRANGLDAYFVFALTLWYLGHTAVSIWNAIMTARVRQPRITVSTTALELGFALGINAKYGSSSKAYLEALNAAEPQDLLTDLSGQIVATSLVYADKACHLGLSVRHLLLSSIPWFAAVIIAIVSLGLPEFGARGYVLLAIGFAIVLGGLWVLSGYWRADSRQGQPATPEQGV